MVSSGKAPVAPYTRAQRTAVDTEEAQARLPQPHIPCVASLSPPLCLPVVSFCVERF